MNLKVGIADYGLGNLHSIARALESIGAAPILVDNGNVATDPDVLVIPGVGAFSKGMLGLRARGLDELVFRLVEKGKPVIGICLGCQMLMSASEEFGSEAGLGLIPGSVALIPESAEPVPLVGWKKLQNVRPHLSATSVALPSVRDGLWAYFVHSYRCLPTDPAHVLATVSHGGHEIAAIIGTRGVIGFQFHPEKSSRGGLRILQELLESLQSGGVVSTSMAIA